ncbi:hypothetical protein [Streptomyces sp. H27-H5]|uniref:hypothetical protein n=1 Tax=Streptomyces sp. H27-H5 TaxID=2996460 RepID=UPI00226D8ADE|nr:hypothetical protein [Streptomyces sp. H27-H5]MCY0962738.1 hypothetical protein [Streptomyces sp. H27-H5]
MTRTKLTIHRGWEEVMFRSTATKALVALHTSKIAAEAIKGAPRRKNSGGTPWNGIKNNIEAYVQNSLEGWYGNVVVERNPRVRHAMLQDQGFRDRSGRRHPGRRFLKAALLKSRIE